MLDNQLYSRFFPTKSGRNFFSLQFLSSSHKFILLKLFSLHYVLCTCLVSAVVGVAAVINWIKPKIECKKKNHSFQLTVAFPSSTVLLLSSRWCMLHCKMPYYYIYSHHKKVISLNILFLTSMVFNWAFLATFQVEFAVRKGYTWTQSRDFWSIFSFWVKKE